MRLISSLALVLLLYSMVAAAPPRSPVAPPRGPAGPTPPTEEFTVGQQDTRLVVVDFKIVESANGKEVSAANPRVSVPIGQTGEVSIGDVVPGGPQGANGQPVKDQFVGTRVMVTPVLRRDGKIQMTFKLRISQLAQGQRAGGAPRIDVREATNNAVASPGQIVVVSGFKLGDIETRITAVPRIMDASAAMKDSPTR